MFALSKPKSCAWAHRILGGRNIYYTPNGKAWPHNYIHVHSLLVNANSIKYLAALQVDNNLVHDFYKLHMNNRIGAILPTHAKYDKQGETV